MGSELSILPRAAVAYLAPIDRQLSLPFVRSARYIKHHGFALRLGRRSVIAFSPINAATSTIDINTLWNRRGLRRRIIEAFKTVPPCTDRAATEWKRRIRDQVAICRMLGWWPGCLAQAVWRPAVNSIVRSSFTADSSSLDILNRSFTELPSRFSVTLRERRRFREGLNIATYYVDCSEPCADKCMVSNLDVSTVHRL